MKSLSSILNECKTAAKLVFRNPFIYYSFRNFALPSTSVLEDSCLVSDDFIPSDDSKLLEAKHSSFRAREEYGIFSVGKDVAEICEKDVLYFNSKIAEVHEVKDISRILTNCGWNLASRNGYMINLNEFNIIRIIDDLFQESSSANLAWYFFKWSESFIGSKHTIRSVCRMIHILTSGNMKHRTMDLLLRLVREYMDEESPSLLLAVLYETHSERNILEIVCSMLVNCYIKENMVNEALKLTCQMKNLLSIYPSGRVYNALLRELIGSKQLELAWEWLDEIQSRGMGLNASTISLFINNYCKGGDLESGWKLLCQMRNYGMKPDVVSYTIIIDTLCKMSCPNLATSLLFKITQFGISPDSVLLSSVIDGYCKSGHMEEAINILKVFKLPHNIFMYNSFISTLCLDGNIVKASRIFHEMTEFGLLPDCFSYTSIIGGYCKVGDIQKGFQYLGKMFKVGIKPSVTTYTTLIDACCKFGTMEMAECLFWKMMTDGLLPDVVVYNTLVHGYGKKGQLQKVFELLDMMKSSNVCPDVVTYNTLIHSLVIRGYVNEAESVLDELIQRGLSPDVVTFTNLIDGFSKRGSFEEAFLVWFYMSEHQVKPDVVTCSAILNGYCRQRHMEEANALFQKMLDIGLNPDLRLYNILIHGFCSVGNMDNACNLVCRMVQCSILPNNVTYRALVLGFEKKWVKKPAESVAFILQEILKRYNINVDIDEYLKMIEQPGSYKAS
ncbi:pentatricopeptide repeat-containing protein At2g19280 [Humulus lupulus]|uniref:pentatricopeptide repeat-containing protein At2g19280 n=1 Tax=Humulus lupulus TaxID=3486 RepID=UPI002B411C54|nr:pentatricopeptide repeat-containing protein At2g19280 [Humulus lupulus]XP_062092050.1 pentatricopeptide repeat-containing protein At2g19280 [Humulus lupulus]XP_062092052.1 pentatricopeptide repeat-containing protein At2g19280 [Humulus lupulus]XP_062092053.1 pentatricopeptide repeat-containing protein At2g19280 [Humulus lupulus]XP_062092054.1 pentatricopeptide repeat-containing protein At2g19280 [Humulus lupulus]XP_062092055.1 pentatricopeptide repeat-containing protein At2g19280 [Humulus lu